MSPAMPAVPKVPLKSAMSRTERERLREHYRAVALRQAERIGRSLRCGGHDGAVPPDQIEHWSCRGIAQSTQDCLCECHDPEETR